MANDVVPDTRRGHRPPEPPSRRRLPRQWVGLTVVVLGIAAATVIVPPLITPHHRSSSAPPPTPAVVTSAPAVVTSPPTTVASASAGVTSAPPSSPPSSSLAAAKFTPISLEAEDPDATLTGGAAPTSCSACRGGGRVRYVCFTCQVVLHTTVPAAGRRTVTVYYESDGDRTVKVRFNDAAPRIFSTPGPGWDTPRSFHFTADLPAGPLRVTLYNDDTPAPDLDEVVIS